MCSENEMKVARLCLTLWDPHGLYSPWNLQARILEWVAYPFSRDLPNPGIEPESPALQVDSLPNELWGKSNKNKVHNKCYVRGSSPNHSPFPTLVRGKIVFHETVTGAKKVGDCCYNSISLLTGPQIIQLKNPKRSKPAHKSPVSPELQVDSLPLSQLIYVRYM